MTGDPPSHRLRKDIREAVEEEFLFDPLVDAANITVLVVRNQRILQAWNARQQDSERRAAKGLPPKIRRRAGGAGGVAGAGTPVRSAWIWS